MFAGPRGKFWRDSRNWRPRMSPITPTNSMHRAIFMDRDGTVSEEVGYMYDPGLYKPFVWAGPAIRRINESGMKAVLITNQSGVERGYFDEGGGHAVDDILQAELERHGANLVAVWF